MEVINYPEKFTGSTALALGFFDGVHRAHREIISLAVSFKDKGLTPGVFTFRELKKKTPSGLLTENEEKKKLLEDLGVEVLALGDFDDLRHLSPREFVEEVLVKKLGAKALVCGYNYRFGKNAQGDVETLRTLCKEFGIGLFVKEEMFFEEAEISSSYIKELLKNGEVARANTLLEKNYSLEGVVIHGRKLGRKMGKPTLNVELDPEKFLPKFGVYACCVTLGGNTYKAVANLGVKPTVTGENTPTLEAFLLDAQGDFYGDVARVSLVDFIREEKKFDNLEMLQKAIETDTRKAAEILDK